jgi:hypothetical protein
MKIGYLAAFVAITSMFSSAHAEETKVTRIAAFKGKCLSMKGSLMPVNNGWHCKLPNGNVASFGSYGSTL